ncbi:protocadherin Fat 4-like [Gigantopelta aegis]|uniref:protocadherin Fat 4-like n=1 Tax=Gigantopelta aegis TaxID=1735272 RepID=UPI001B888863|nr:protocadherin Fat 4-like [Gigantopelta aegis]
MKTGIVTLGRVLDADTVNFYSLTIIVEDHGLPSLTSTGTLIINVEDVNDHHPRFSSDIGYKSSLLEHTSSANASETLTLKLVPALAVFDDDITSNASDIRFRLDGNESGKFSVDEVSGEITVAAKTTFDSDTKNKYLLKLIAEDEYGLGLSSATIVEVFIEDINDNAPVFNEMYVFNVTSSAVIGSQVGRVMATDADSSPQNSAILYFIESGGYGKFRVDSQTGLIRVSSSLVQEPFKDAYELNITAVDLGNPPLSSQTTVQIVVDTSDNKPAVIAPSQNFHLPENASIGDVVGLISLGNVTSDDLEFRLAMSNIPFKMNATSGEILLTSSVDREQTDEVSFTVDIVNHGVPTFTVTTEVKVTIDDVNDNWPQFSAPGGYRGVIVEYTDTMMTDGLVSLNQLIHVTDKDVTEVNRNVSISLSGVGADLFVLDEANGEIRVKQPHLLDFEQTTVYNLQLTATDCGGGGLSTSTNLTIEVEDVNDNGPQFEQNYTFSISPSVQMGSSVGNITAVDLDSSERNNQVTYILLRGGFGKFFIHPDTGEITTTDSLTHEPPIEKFYLEVVALDNGFPRQTTSTVVEVNVAVNHKPTMPLKQEFNVDENVVNGTEVGIVMANDTDIVSGGWQNLTFYMEDNTVPFTIDEETGLIQIAGDIDREVEDRFFFSVFVVDSGTPRYTATSAVVVYVNDVNDNAPVLSGGDLYLGTVKEDDVWANGSQIVQMGLNITAIDLDATSENQQVVLLLDGPGSEMFYLNNETGTVHLTKPGSVDRELNETFYLRILAIDKGGKGLTSSATLKIDVEDVNDNFPKFVQSEFKCTLSSLVGPGDVVGRVTAHDDDATEPNNQLLYLLTNDTLGKFRVDINTGDLIVLESFFSRPRRDEYSLTVEARDMGFPSRTSYTKVTVSAPDLQYNDYPPDIRITSFVIKEELPIGTIIGNLDVVDKDVENTTENIVDLELITNDIDPVPFEVQPTGSIVTTGKIDRDSKTTGKRYFNFKVCATDKGTPPFNVTRDISVIIEDVNDNPPTFTMRKYEHMISDSFPTRTVIATPFAFDSVDETDSVYEYSIAGGKAGVIHIDKSTGVVITTDKAKTLKPDTLTYTVKAVDKENNQLSAEAKLIIKVIKSESPCK